MTAVDRRIVLVTGANKGLGLETARQLGQLGHVVLLGARDADRGKAAELALRGEHIDATHVMLDVTDPGSVADAARWIDRAHGRLDVLVNNAGIHAQRAVPSALAIQNVRKTFDVNFFGALLVMQAMLPLLRRSAAARIVNVSTSVGSLFRVSDPQWEFAEQAYPSLAYSASKAALNAMTIYFANELAGTTIKVNAVEPGFAATDFNQHRGTKAPADAVRVIVHYASLADDGPSGGFFDERGRLPW